MTLSVIEGIESQANCVLLAPHGNDLGKQAVISGSSFEPIKCIQPDRSTPLKYAQQFAKYLHLFLKYKPSIVHTGDLLALRSIQPICKLLGIPIVCHVHFPYEHGFMRWVFSNRYAPYAFIFCSSELRESLIDDLKKYCPQSKYLVIHNGIDTNKYTPKPHPENDIPRIGIVANLQYRKGHNDFLHMARILTDKGIEAQFDIIGGDILQEPREPALRALAKELDIADRVTFHGQLSDVREMIAQLDIYVCASHEEAFPISILEAMACEKPIVSTNVNGIPEALENNENALLAEPHSPNELAKCVERLLFDSQLKRTLSKAAKETVTKSFSRNFFVDKVLSLYSEIR